MSRTQEHNAKISTCARRGAETHGNEAPRGAKTVAGVATGALLGGAAPPVASTTRTGKRSTTSSTTAFQTSGEGGVVGAGLGAADLRA